MPDRAAHLAHLGSIGEALDEAVPRLARAGIGDPRREAMALWAAVAGGGMKPGAVWLERASDPSPDVARRFEQALERRLHGMPFAYAAGRTGFRTLELELDRRALIPRPETEGLVDLVLRDAGKREEGRAKGGVVADIGTGCGCIALSLAVEGNFERVIAIERSGEAAALARENVALVRPPVPVEVREGDLLAPVAGERCRAKIGRASCRERV